jgi:hypothetical protein
MKYLLLLVFAAIGMAQTTLVTPVVVTGTTQTCTFDSQDSVGGVFAECVLSDGTISYSAVIAVADNAVVGNAEVGCLYGTDSTGKFRLQCYLAGKKTIDGYMPPVVRKKRWFLVWR